MTTVFPIILAGGSGSRLWPLSRKMFPKQMLKADERYTLFQRTFVNLAEFADDKNIITVTNIGYLYRIKDMLKELQEKFERKYEYKTVTEPLAKNTAAAIALGVRYVELTSNFTAKDCVIVTVPSDHLIFSRKDYTSCLKKGISLAKEGYIVSFSTETEEVNENFGYLKTRKNSKITEIEEDALKVTGFIEKPDTKAKKDALKGKVFVNSGVYMFTPETFMSELKKYEPEIFDIINSITPGNTLLFENTEKYESLPSLSVDYAIMEKTKKLVTIPMTGWKDIGSWNAVYEISEKDSNGNSITGKVIDIDSENNLIYSPDKLTAVIGISDKNIVVTEDAVLVSDRNDNNAVKNLYEKLDGKNEKIKEIHNTVYRPWGYYTVLEEDNGFLTKCITVNPEGKLSLQLHKHRSEHWIVLEGQATVVKGSETYTLNAGESIDIGVEEVHSLQNLSDVSLKIIEVQQGDILDEEDIERIEDIYGRV